MILRLALVIAVTAGLVSIASLREARPYVVVGAFVLGAIFTPPDIISQFMLAIPLLLLYEAGILVSSLMQRYRSDDDTDSQLAQLENH